MDKYIKTIKTYNFKNNDDLQLQCKLVPNIEKSNNVVCSSAFTYYDENEYFMKSIKICLGILIFSSCIIYNYLTLPYAIGFFIIMLSSLPYYMPYYYPSIKLAKNAPSNMRPTSKDLSSNSSLKYFNFCISQLNNFKEITWLSLERKEREFSCQIKNDKWIFYDSKKKTIPELNTVFSEWLDRMCITKTDLKRFENAAAFEGRSYLIDVIVFILYCFQKMNKMPKSSMVNATPYIHKFTDGYGIVWKISNDGSHKCHIMNDDIKSWINKNILTIFTNLFKKEKNETKEIIIDCIRKYGFNITGDFLANDYDDQVLALVLLEILVEYNEKGEFDLTIEQIKNIVSS